MVCADFWFFFSNTCLMRDACCLSALLASLRYSATLSSRASCSTRICSVIFRIFCCRCSSAARVLWTSPATPSGPTSTLMFPSEPPWLTEGGRPSVDTSLLSSCTHTEKHREHATAPSCNREDTQKHAVTHTPILTPHSQQQSECTSSWLFTKTKTTRSQRERVTHFCSENISPQHTTSC